MLRLRMRQCRTAPLLPKRQLDLRHAASGAGAGEAAKEQRWRGTNHAVPVLVAAKSEVDRVIPLGSDNGPPYPIADVDALHEGDDGLKRSRRTFHLKMKRLGQTIEENLVSEGEQFDRIFLVQLPYGAPTPDGINLGSDRKGK